MSTNPLTPSFRKVHTIPSDAAHPAVVQAIRDNDKSITDINQAIATLKNKITANTSANASTAATITENVTTETVSESWIYLGTINNQLESSAYTTQQSDDGAKILVGDSTPSVVTLNPSVTLPWFTIIGNDSTSSVGLASTSPIYGVRNISPGCYVYVNYDGSSFWSEGIQYAQDSTPGIVQPDNVTIGLDSTDGVVYGMVGAGHGPPDSTSYATPGTLGNLLYFDSTSSPWHGYIWYGSHWNRFS